MEKYLIEGGNKVCGQVRVDCAKNALLPIIAATVAVRGKVFLKDVPRYSDVEVMLKIISQMGGRVEFIDSGVLVDTDCMNSSRFPDDLFKQIRASVFMLGGVLGRFGKAEAVLPGGCSIGDRPIDIHLFGLKKMGAEIVADGNRVKCTCDSLSGAEIDLPFPSVGATEDLIIAACLARGKTVISNAAREPEVADLIDFLNLCGAKIRGKGTSVLEICGGYKLTGVEYRAISDRIEASTFSIAAAMLGGEIEIVSANMQNFFPVINKIANSACKIYSFNDKIYIKSKGIVKCCPLVKTAPYPGFPTDAQAQIVAMLSVADGQSVVKDEVFPNRFGFTRQLKRLGADVEVKANTAIINGVSHLSANDVYAEDLRGGAALVLACLRAEGVSSLHGVSHVERGYCNFHEKLRGLDLKIKKVNTEEEL